MVAQVALTKGHTSAHLQSISVAVGRAWQLSSLLVEVHKLQARFLNTKFDSIFRVAHERIRTESTQEAIDYALIAIVVQDVASRSILALSKQTAHISCGHQLHLLAQGGCAFPPNGPHGRGRGCGHVEANPPSPTPRQCNRFMFVWECIRQALPLWRDLGAVHQVLD